MNVAQHLETYEETNKKSSNAKTKFASMHIAILGLATGLTRTQTEVLLMTSADVFIKLMEDIDRKDKKFSVESYVNQGLSLFDYLTTVSIYEEIDMKEGFNKGE